MIPLPPLATLRLVGAAVLLVGAAWAGWSLRANSAERDIAEIHAAQAISLATEVEKARADERAVQTKQTEVINAAAAKQPAFRAAVRAAAVAGDGLRYAAATVAARCPSDPAVVAVGADAANPARVLADVLADVERVGRTVAATADERGIAVDACVGSYNALRTTP